MFTLDEMLAAYEEYYGPESVRKIRSVGIIPPYEPPNADTDEDSDLSDDQVEGNPAHLPGRILRSQVQVTLEESNEEIGIDETEESQPSSSKQIRQIQSDKETQIEELEDPQPSTSKRIRLHKKKKIKPSESIWSSTKTRVWSLPPVEKPSEPLITDFLKNTIASPLDAFKCFFTDKLVNHIVLQSNLYAGQKGEHNMNITYEEIHTVLGILLISGYHRLPSKRMYWQEDPDCKVSIVSEAMRRRRFEDILRYIHLNDNTYIGTDSFYKVRPLFDHLNDAFKQNLCGGSLSVDESIIPYYGRHHAKQFIRGKPIRFGFKLWVIAKPNGYIMHAEPYCGSNTKLPDTGLGQGGDVVIGLVDYCSVPQGTKLYFDNLFTSVPLLEELCKRNLGGTGTLRENRIGKVMKLPSKKDFKKSQRGKYVSVGNEKLIAVTWNDNAVVTVLSNCDEEQPTKSIQRYSRTEKKKVTVKIPNTISQYNSNMGGVDLNDQFVSQYRTTIRIKKWWWPLFAWGVDECCVQAWLLYRELGHDMPLLQFRRQVVLQLLNAYGTPSLRPGPVSSYARSVSLDDIRRDGRGHLIIKGESKYRRCKVCQNRTMYLCKKCQVPLHPECFEPFHDI